MKVAANYDIVTKGNPNLRVDIGWLTQMSIRDKRNDVVHSGRNHIPVETVNNVISRAESFLSKVRDVVENTGTIQQTVQTLRA